MPQLSYNIDNYEYDWLMVMILGVNKVSLRVNSKVKPRFLRMLDPQVCTIITVRVWPCTYMTSGK